jgi:hypothetical protein
MSEVSAPNRGYSLSEFSRWRNGVAQEFG